MISFFEGVNGCVIWSACSPCGVGVGCVCVFLRGECVFSFIVWSPECVVSIARLSLFAEWSYPRGRPVVKCRLLGSLLVHESSEVQTGIGPIRMVSGDSRLLPHPHSQLAYTCTQTRLYTCQYPHPNNFCPHTHTHKHTCAAHLPRPTHRHPNFLSLTHTHTLHAHTLCIFMWHVF